MKQALLALVLGLAMLPAVAIADPGDSAAPSAPLSPAQRQQRAAEFQAARQKAMQMHEQLRSQILGALSSDHRTAIANAIGEMAISASPDPAAAAKQIDGILSSSEQQKILELHGTFQKQMQTLMQQLHAQLARPSSTNGANEQRTMPAMPAMNDAGNVLLMVLTHRPPMEMMHDHHMPMAPGGPQPPGGPPPEGPPPQ